MAVKQITTPLADEVVRGLRAGDEVAITGIVYQARDAAHKRLVALLDAGEPLPFDGGDAEKVIAAFAKAGIDDNKLAADLQREGAESFVKSWKDLLDRIRSKHTALKAGG